MLQAGQVLQERYQLTHRLGQNAGRQTWLAQDLTTADPEAVIVKLLAFGGEVQWDDLKLFEREAQVLKQLSHPQIPKYRDYFCLDERSLWFGLVQDYIPGSSLRQLLDEGKRFTEVQVRSVVKELLEILIYLHELSPAVLHRDIKPSNIILGIEGKVYLVDFGAVQDRAKAEGATFTVVGTSGYAPPEQLWGRAVPASDLYALGATLIHLLTGTPPAELPQRNLRIQFRDKVQLNPQFVSWLEQLIDPAPERRFSNAHLALEALPAEPAEAGNQTQQPSAESSARYGRLAFLATLQLLIVTGTVGLVALPTLFCCNVKTARQAEAKVYVRSMNRAQQADFLEEKRFAPSIEKLNLGILTQTNYYNYSIQASPKAVINYGMARQNNLKSYVGGVFVVPLREFASNTFKGEMTTVSILCESKSAGVTQISAPIYQGDEPKCGIGTTELTSH